MINSIWSLCHACPAMPVDSRPSNMRSKSRWSEYPGSASEVVQRAPTSAGVLDPLLAHGVHHKSDEIHVHENLYDSLDDLMDGAGASDPRNDTGVVSRQPSSSHSSQPSASQFSFRRSRSEGPSPYGTPARGQGSGDGLMALWAGRRRRLPVPETGDWAAAIAGQTSRGSSNERPPSVSEYRLQFAWPPGGKPQLHHHQHFQPNVQQKMPGEISHGPTQELQPAVTSTASNEEQLVDEDVGDGRDGKPRRRRYKTEYSKKFRPFSLYHYVDGKFQKSKEMDAEEIHSDPWYREVLELRKQAGSYKYRGWGSELLPEHMADLYNKQLEVWEQVSRRSSLSALALASATPRSVSKEDKDRVSVRKGSPLKSSNRQPSSFKRDTPKKTAEEVDGRRDPSMTRQRPPTGVSSGKSKKPRASAVHPPASSVAPGNRPNLGVIFHPASSGRSQSAGPDARNKKPARTPSSATPSVHKPSSKIKPSKSENSSWDDLPPPIVAPTTAVIPPDDNDLPVPNQDEVSELVPDLALMKSPPEPTRVKSPEQLVVRSPDPVNWTVPLDTGKTFTVTSNIREGDMIRPNSELKFSMSVRPSPLKNGVSSLDSVHVKHMAPVVPALPTTGVNTPLGIAIMTNKDTGMAPLPGEGGGGGQPVKKITNGEQESRELIRIKTPSPIKKDPPVDLKRNFSPEPLESPNVSSKAVESPKISPKVVESPIISPKVVESPKIMESPKLSPKFEVTNGEPEPQDAPQSPVTKPHSPAELISTIQKTDDKEKRDASPETSTLPKFSPKSEDFLTKPGSLALTTSTEEPEKFQKEVSEKEKDKEKEKPKEKKESTPVLKSVPGTTLRCLEDPVFSSIPPLAPSKPRAPYRVLEAPTFPSAIKPVPSSSSVLPQYRVLEAQGPSDVMYQPISSAFPVSAPSSSPYRVLEAPGASKPETASSSQAPSLVSPSTGRSLASDVLEKARTRFDRFWGGKKEEK